MSRTDDLGLVASSRDCRWASWTVSQPLLGQSGTQHLSSVLCGFPLGSVLWAPKGRLAVGRGWRWTEAQGEDGGGVLGWRLGWGLRKCEHFLKAGVSIQSSEGSPSSLALRIQEELGVGGSWRRSCRFSCALGPVLLTSGLHTRVQGTRGCPASVDCQGLPA